MDTQRLCPSCQKPLAADAPQGICPECLLKAGIGSSVGGGAPEAPEGGFVPPPIETVRQLFPQLEILELIGKGGMGAVYKARQPGLDRLVALKILPPRSGSDPGFAERFTREARALARLNHPHIVAVYDFGQAGDLNYFLMEYVDGLNLRQVEQAAKLSPREALRIIPQICEALQFAHDEGIVHRDIKPENVLLDKKGRAKIADFGLARILGREPSHQRLTGARDVMGTPHYMAPEQVESPRAVDHRADIFSLGVVFYEMLTGELPLGRFAPPSQRAQIDVRLDEVVLRALEKDPERRYQQVRDVKTEVETISSGPGAVSPPAQAREDTTAARQLVKWPALGVLAGGILNWVTLPIILLYFLPAVARSGFNAHLPAAARPFFLLLLVAPLLLCSFVIFAALKMKRLDSYPIAITGSILGMLVAPGSIIGLPAGIWALVTLTRPDVRQAFGRTSPRPGGLKWLLLMAVAAVLAASCALFAIKREQRLQVQPVPLMFQKEFTRADVPISRDLAPSEVGGWTASCVNTQTFRLFEVPMANIDNCTLNYQARLKSDGLKGRAYLEMWCHFATGAEFFSRGLESTITGSNDWAASQTSFFLKNGEQPDLIRLNLVVEGAGQVFIDDIQLTAVSN